jgi:hypothetical protein
MNEPRIELLARQLHLLDLFELRRHGNCPDTWAECDESKCEEWRTVARETIRAYAAQAAREN